MFLHISKALFREGEGKVTKTFMHTFLTNLLWKKRQNKTKNGGEGGEIEIEINQNSQLSIPTAVSCTYHKPVAQCI